MRAGLRSSEGGEIMVLSTGEPEYRHQALTDKIIRTYYDVYNMLGFGFLEKVYENALAIRLRRAGLAAVQQHPISVYFDGIAVGDYFADLLVEDAVILELKAVKVITAEHEAQLINYLKATKYEVGLLLNFGPSPKVTRKAFDNRRKKLLR
jgi:GxxExxY protein